MKISDTPFHVRVEYTPKYAALVASDQRVDFIDCFGGAGALVAKFAGRQDAIDYANFKSGSFLSYQVWEEGAYNHKTLAEARSAALRLVAA